ncbi:isochorismatase family protein [Streptomyces sp. NPDC004629]|uniref:isochorismatase family protein n=1 Tax=Streptomyces sp. NPDC004629 TaxID=3364705 RepID=UPI0036910BBD
MSTDASRHTTLDDLFRARAERHPERMALVDADDSGARWTYGELDERVEHRTAALAARGVRAGGRVVLRLPGSPRLFEEVLALFRLGAVPVVVPPAVPEPMARSVRRFAGADVSYEVDGPALLQFAGDEVGVPRLAPLDDAEVVRTVSQRAAVLDLDEDTVHLVTHPELPVGVPGLLDWLAVLCAGGRVVLGARADPDSAFRVVAAERVTHTVLSAPLAGRWAATAAVTAYDLSSLRTLVVNGGGFDERVARRVLPALGCALRQVFGTAEGLVAATRPQDGTEAAVTGRMGAVCPEHELRVVDHRDREVPAGTEGWLLSRGPGTIRRYWRSPGHDARHFTTDGFHRTGATARATEAGLLVVVRGPAAPAGQDTTTRVGRRNPAPHSRKTRPHAPEGQTEMTPPTLPYVMPTPAMLPADRTGWTLEAARSALVVLNLRTRFVHPLEQRAAPVAELLANAGRLIDAARAAGVPVIHAVPATARRTTGRGPLPYARLTGPAAGAATDAFVTRVEPQTGDTVLTARTHSAFAGTRLDSRLREQERDQVVVLGLYARTDVLLTAADARARDLEAFVVADAVADVSAGNHAFALEWVADTCGAVTAADRVSAVFDAGQAEAEAV